MPDVPYRAAVLTVSDRGSRGESVDTAGPAVAAILQGGGFTVVERAVVPDEPAEVASTLRRWADEAGYDVVVTTGGTGLTPRDRTPEATAEVLDYRIPGMEEAMRAAGIMQTRMAMLSRGVVGVRGRTIIINVPGSERAARQNLEVVLPVLIHACDSLEGDGAAAREAHEGEQR